MYFEMWYTVRSVSLHGHFRKRILMHLYTYRGAGKSLALTGRKQATATEDFDSGYERTNWMSQV